jgi:putative ABC transport system ATP-binding protein
VLEVFNALNAAGHTIIMITHDANIARWARRVVHIIDGVMTEGEVAAGV